MPYFRSSEKARPRRRPPNRSNQRKAKRPQCTPTFPRSVCNRPTPFRQQGADLVILCPQAPAQMWRKSGRRHSGRGRAGVMIVPTCSPRSAAVSRPGTSPFTTCTRSRWRAVAMTSSSARSSGSVPCELCKVGGARLPDQLACFAAGPLGSAVYTPSTSSTIVRPAAPSASASRNAPVSARCIGMRECGNSWW